MTVGTLPGRMKVREDNQPDVRAALTDIKSLLRCVAERVELIQNDLEWDSHKPVEFRQALENLVYEHERMSNMIRVTRRHAA